MKTIILGAGAVGGYFGGRLAQAGYPVTFLVREKRFNQLKENGLVVHSFKGDFSVEPDIEKMPEAIENPKVVVVALKNYHLESAIPSIKQLVGKGAKVLPLLNGVQHLNALIEEVGKENVLGGSCYIESTLNDKGEIVHTSPMQDIIFGSLTGEDDPAFLQEIELMMAQAGIQVILSDHILQDMWSKYLFLAILSGITSSTRQPIGISLNDPVTRHFLLDLVTEVCEVAKSRISLPDDIVYQLVKRIEGIKPSMTSSMHRDLEKGLPIEIDSIHGALLQMGEEANLVTPSIRAVYALLHPYKNGRPIK